MRETAPIICVLELFYERSIKFSV